VVRVPVVAAVLLCTTLANAAEFDREAAKRALEKVHVKHCGYGGPGEVRVTFAPTGFVSDVEVYDGKYTENAIRCIERLFRAPEVLAFDGEAQTIKWSITLPLEKTIEKPAPKVIVSDYKYVEPSKWRPGYPVPPGYRIEEEPRVGLAFGGVVLTLAGVGLVVAAASKSGESSDVDLLSPAVAVAGVLVAVGGAIMILAGVSSTKTRLVPKSANP
jgi:hypothetical protein